ncbi:glycosyltransferase [Salix suchowensis]|nr:glycosyltransferase [Salix suchowensis]
MNDYLAQVEDSPNEVFHSPTVFRMNYAEMERGFKIFVYRDRNTTKYCDLPRKHNSKYESEEYFFRNLKTSPFLTDDPEEAHLFFIPICSQKMMTEGRSVNERSMAMVDFVMSLISNYPYWNRTLGADHFFVTCSDIHVTATARIVNLMKNSIRVMCSPRYDVEYVPHKDVSLPQNVQPFDVSAAGSDTRERTTLAFWSGQPDSHIRETLINSWGFDPELEIHIGFEASTAEGRWEFHDDLSKSKFCICPGGPQLDGVLAAAINYGCVPVILSDYYDVPFKDILDWKKFSVIIKEIDVYQLKKILAEIPKKEYEDLHTNAIMVQKHFEWNLPSVRLDAFHMVMYELWMRRRVTKY